MKSSELTVLEQDELQTKLKESRRELYELRFKLAVGQLEDHRQVRKLRRDLARILTVIHQRELGIAPPRAEVVEAEASAPAPARRGRPKAEPEAEPAEAKAEAKSENEAVAADADGVEEKES